MKVSNRNKIRKTNFKVTEYGLAPSWGHTKVTDKDYDNKYNYAVNWASYSLDIKELKANAIEWARNNNVDAGQLGSLNEGYFAHYGIVAWLMNKNAPLRPSTLDWFASKTKELLDMAITSNDHQTEPTQDEPEKVELVKGGKAIVAYVDLYSTIDNIVATTATNDVKVKIVDLVKSRGIKRNMMTKLAVHYKDNLNESTEDRTVPGVATLMEKWRIVVDVLNGSKTNAKVTVRNRRKRVKSVEAQAKRVKFMAKDDTYNIVSMNPSSIIGASCALLFNVKRRNLSIYFAEKGGMLGIKGTKITNFDQTKSLAKKLRKPNDILAQIRNANARRAEVVLNENVRGKAHSLNGKINSETVILKVFA